LKVILLGPPGAGKGTQAARISDALGIPKVASGDLFRDHQRRNTELGQLARSYMERGVLVPDDVTIKMVMDWIDREAGAGGFLLDGFPRTDAQATALDQAMEDRGGIDKAIYINVSQYELVKRLSNRLVCTDCQTPHSAHGPEAASVCTRCGGTLYQRDDDKPEAVRKRIQVYMEETAPLIGHYRDLGILDEVDGDRTIDEVGSNVAALISPTQVGP
jgi:adenylate kinase